MAARFYIELRTDPHWEFCRTALRRKHPPSEKAACLSAQPSHRFQMAQEAPGARCEVLSTAARRFPTEGSHELLVALSPWHSWGPPVNSTMDVVMTRPGVQEPQKNVSKTLVTRSRPPAAARHPYSSRITRPDNYRTPVSNPLVGSSPSSVTQPVCQQRERSTKLIA